jgi:DNA-binding IclR family transcriptional regulator
MLSRYLAEPLEAFTERTLTDAASLLERLRDIRRDGHAWVRDEYAVGISSVAAPIADARAEIVAAVHVHGPSYRFPVAGDEERIAAAVRAAAARIGARLRANG